MSDKSLQVQFDTLVKKLYDPDFSAFLIEMYEGRIAMGDDVPKAAACVTDMINMFAHIFINTMQAGVSSHYMFRMQNKRETA